MNLIFKIILWVIILVIVFIVGFWVDKNKSEAINIQGSPNELNELFGGEQVFGDMTGQIMAWRVKDDLIYNPNEDWDLLIGSVASETPEGFYHDSSASTTNMEIASTSALRIPGIAVGSERCVQIDADGDVAVATAACGTGGGTTFDDNLWHIDTSKEGFYASVTGEVATFQEVWLGSAASSTADFLFNFDTGNFRYPNASGTDETLIDAYITNLWGSSGLLNIGDNASGTQISATELWGTTGNITTLYSTNAIMSGYTSNTGDVSGADVWGTTGNFTNLFATNATMSGYTSGTGDISTTNELWCSILNTTYASTTDVSLVDLWGTNGLMEIHGKASVTSDISFQNTGGATNLWYDNSTNLIEMASSTQLSAQELWVDGKRIPNWNEKGFALEDPTDADDNIPFYFPREAVTITDVYCQVDGGTSIAVTISDGTNALEAITCDDDGAEDDGSIANGTFTALERMEADLSGAVGTNTWLTVIVTVQLTN